ncbi:unnamed protein product [Rangifer tarandus platyrhynchus]|uniref:Uncharacterized protein n=2 Tax=Rangifer tarandus platyrhynchus TaxID=3082113 RepID=A0ABN9A044_RANTA|nr:unnamed protein product [Rangifer tarandus platyrhynchus]
MQFSRQKYWSGMSCLSPEDLPELGIEPVSLTFPALEGRFFTTSTTREALTAARVMFQTQDSHQMLLWPHLSSGSQHLKVKALATLVCKGGPALSKGFPGGAEVKNPPAGEETQETRFDPWVRKTPGRGHGNPLQYSCLQSPMDRGAWRGAVHGVTDESGA